MTNAEIAALLAEMSVLLELDGADFFRVRAYQKGAEAVAALSRPFSELAPGEILEVPGIGKSIAAHLGEIVRTGCFPELVALRAKFPAGLRELLRVEGLGPKRARQLFDALKIDSPQKLRAAALSGKLRGLKGFGDKLEAKLLKGLDFADQTGRRFLLWDARELMGEIVAALEALPGVGEASPAGSLRRGRESVGDLDVLCAARDGARVIAAFLKLPQVDRTLASGPTKATVWLKAGIQCDLRVVPPESFGAALQYFTGSKEHNVALREHAQRRGLTVNEYGVFRVSDKTPARPLAGRTEKEVYAKLGMSWIPPELREARGELEAALKGSLPRLVELEDVRGDFHNHSEHTDGKESLDAMARAARERGWEWVALGDHSRSLKVARGLSVPDLRKTLRELDGVRAKVKGISLLRSMEVDILPDGSLDYPDDVLGELDVVVGSVHTAFGQERAAMTERILKAVRHPRLHAIGHLTGRLLNRRPGYEVDTEAVLKAAAEAGTALEINGQPERQELADVHARRAQELGVPLAVTTDAHAASQFGFMALSVIVARRAWLTKEDLVNCRGLKDFQAWLKDKKD